MNNLFLALVFISFIGFIIGLIKPSWLKLKSRKLSSLIFGIVFFVSLALLGANAPANNQQISQSVTTIPSTQTTTTPSQPQSLEQQITQAVTNVLGATNNEGKPTVANVEVNPYDAAELKQYGYKPTDKINGILITVNSSENLTNNMTKDGMAMDAIKIFQAVFPSSSQIGDVIIWSQLPLKDEYGNVKEGTAISFAMGEPLFKKINWANITSQDLPTLLTNENSIDDRNVYYVAIKDF